MTEKQERRPWTMWGKRESGGGYAWTDIMDIDEAKRIARENRLFAFLLVPQDDGTKDHDESQKVDHLAYRYDESAKGEYAGWATRRFCFYTLIDPPKGFTRDTA